ncbi:hypothetical protein CEP51_004677 [Fusarium floridanum]|uniref:Uncharacterized protein n=1 Tax=Fusarium floridanum TaxID=1325733 RepID=A0A428S030_9HYPO|nr:hypothetical protein CEP51_004677 [Fusarium floridanum]
MLKATELNFIAKGDLSQLEEAILFLKQQQDIIESFNIALRALKRGLHDYNKRHRRRKCFDDMTTFISQNYNETNNRRRALESLDHSSKYFCFISLTSNQIDNLTDNSFDALIDGTHEFIEANPSRHDLIRTASREKEAPQTEGIVFYQQPPPPKNLTGKRRKRASSRTPSPRRPEPPRPSNPAPMPSTTAIMAEVIPDRQDQVHSEQTGRTEPDLQSNSSPATQLDPPDDPSLDNSMPAESDSQPWQDTLAFNEDAFWLFRGIDLDPEQFWGTQTL